MAKDRARPFSRKHVRYWLPVTGGMILIGATCLSIGFCTYEGPPPAPEKIELVLPPSPYAVDAAPAPAPPADATAR